MKGASGLPRIYSDILGPIVILIAMGVQHLASQHGEQWQHALECGRSHPAKIETLPDAARWHPAGDSTQVITTRPTR